MEKYPPFLFQRLNLIGLILLKKGLVNTAQLQQALEIQKKEGGLLGGILLKQKFISEEALYIAIAEQCGLVYLPLERYAIAEELRGLVPKEMCLQYLFIPIERIGDVLNVAIADPFNKKAIEAIQKSVPYKVDYTISTKTDIEKRVIREMR